MGTSVNEQLRQITAALVAGGVVGLLFDLLSVRCGPLRKARGILPATASAVLIFTVGRASGAGLRLFFLLAAAGGVCLYRWALHPMICADLTVAKQFLQYYAELAHKIAANYVKRK